MKKDLNQIVLAAELLAALLVIGAVSIWAPVCSGLLTLQNGSLVHMKCFYTAQAARALAIILIAYRWQLFILGQTATRYKR